MLKIIVFEPYKNHTIMGVAYNCPITGKRKRNYKRFSSVESAGQYYANICDTYIGMLFEKLTINKALPHIKKLFWDQFNGIIRKSEIVVKHKKELIDCISYNNKEKETETLNEILRIARTWIKRGETK